MNKRTAFILFMLFVLMVPMLAACGGSKSDVAGRPTIHLKIGDRTYTENIYSYCWPESKDNLACNVDETALVQPINNAPVTKGDEVHFIIDSTVGNPKKFSATLLDSSDVQDLGTSNDGIYKVALEDNLYHIQVDAQYDNIEGKPAFVSYVFGLQVAGVIVATPTPLPTDTPVPTATLTETPVPTATNTPEPTATSKPSATPKPTEAPVLTATAMLTPTTSIAVVPGVTPATNTPEPPGDLGQMTLSGTVQVAGITTAIAGAQVSYSHSSMARPERSSSGSVTTDTNGRFSFSSILVHDTDQIIVSVQAPGYTPQSIRRSGIETWNTGGIFDFGLASSEVPTPMQPVATSTTLPNAVATLAPTQIPTVVLPPTAIAPQPTSGVVPPLSLVIGGREFLPAGYQFCQRSASGERICIELPASATTAERLSLLRGSAAQLKIGGTRPTQVEIVYLSDTGQATGQPETRPGDNILLLTITPEPGSYIMSLHVSWATEDATYFFRITVSN